MERIRRIWEHGITRWVMRTLAALVISAHAIEARSIMLASFALYFFMADYLTYNMQNHIDRQSEALEQAAEHVRVVNARCFEVQQFNLELLSRLKEGKKQK